jgi:phytoene synthase
VRRYGLPAKYLHEMIDGVSSDLEPRRIETFEELYRYCYLVASVVGLTIIHIFQFDSPEALPMAEKCGIAFQLTNILRDVREDRERGRVYLPEEDLRRFGVDPARFVYDQRFRELMSFEAGRARQYYREAGPLVELVHKDSRRSLAALIAIYRRLLDKIERSGYDVLSRRVQLSAAEKAWVVARSYLGGLRSC